ncbi:hypothetical protein PUNSTDRAFT_138863 [Punctularia strigosozonata HHB-11173 SS5]|uniref:Uncharacterized protein n=1 Tax=Punctularia strigosozonata (strain HHB-11173) TaxID=741275 RepID=R7S2Q8_PUNST|nr:uncharacterized protein PUNSTDRAFT_138863 [Punctularia strigosozonata HHB-11173 SS5]EIN04134.1 hypothetical protein PUNSTDRAFT_138863 [Punctularia strigosozonata HHB-11173 SS5]
MGHGRAVFFNIALLTASAAETAEIPEMRLPSIRMKKIMALKATRGSNIKSKCAGDGEDALCRGYATLGAGRAGIPDNNTQISYDVLNSASARTRGASKEGIREPIMAMFDDMSFVSQGTVLGFGFSDSDHIERIKHGAISTTPIGES